MSAMAEPSLVPKGRPSKAFFTVGAVGCIINTIAAMWFLLDAYVSVFRREPFWIIGYFLLVIGLSLASVGYLGTRCNYGSGAGTASFAIAIVVSILFLLWAIWRAIGYPFFHGYEEYWLLRSYVLATIYELFFVMMILWGVTHVTTRRFTGNSGLSLATGIMLILAAVFVNVWTTLWFVDTLWWYHGYHEFVLWRIVDVFDLVWTSLFFVSEILATILFFMAKVPELSAKSVT